MLIEDFEDFEGGILDLVYNIFLYREEEKQRRGHPLLKLNVLERGHCT